MKMPQVRLKPIVDAILIDYELPPDGIHGVAHWARVLENGLRVAEETGADPVVVSLFAVFHDSCRTNDGHDPRHGARGAEQAARLRPLFDVSESQFALLQAACTAHTDGETDGPVTVRTCWDADRLDLGRVGICPHPARLCTDAARSPRILRWADARACDGTVPELVRVEWKLDVEF